MRPLRILFVTPYVPSLLRTRPRAFLKFLAERGHRPSLLAAASSAEEASTADELREFCERVTVVRVPLARSLWNCARGLVGTVPLQALYSYSPALRSTLQRELGRGGVDLVHVEHLRAALVGLSVQGVPRVYDAVDCISSLFAQAAREAPSAPSRWLARLDLGRTRRFEAGLLRQFDASLVTSETDKEALLQLSRGKTAAEHLSVVPNGVDLDYFSPGTATRAPDEIVFVGRMGYHANVAAALHLVDEIMPLVWRDKPGTRLTIVGADPVPAIRALAVRHDRVEVTGAVADVRPYLRRATLAACPVVYAAGIQNKVLEAMACATPVVASPAACRALSARAGADLLQASQPAAFSREIMRLLADDPLRARLGDSGRRYAETHHDWKAVVGSLEELYQGARARFGIDGGSRGSGGDR